jgi:hypothetical protein
MADMLMAGKYFAKVNNFLDDLQNSGQTRMAPDELKGLVLENFPEFKDQIDKIDFNDPNLVEIMLKMVPLEYQDICKMFLKRFNKPNAPVKEKKKIIRRKNNGL